MTTRPHLGAGWASKPTSGLKPTVLTVRRPGPLEAPRQAYTIEEACEALCIGKATLYEQMNSGRLRYYQITEGGRRYISVEAVLDFIHEREAATNVYTPRTLNPGRRGRN